MRRSPAGVLRHPPAGGRAVLIDRWNGGPMTGAGRCLARLVSRSTRVGTWMSCSFLRHTCGVALVAGVLAVMAQSHVAAQSVPGIRSDGPRQQGAGCDDATSGLRCAYVGAFNWLGPVIQSHRRCGWICELGPSRLAGHVRRRRTGRRRAAGNAAPRRMGATAVRSGRDIRRRTGDDEPAGSRGTRRDGGIEAALDRHGRAAGPTMRLAQSRYSAREDWRLRVSRRQSQTSISFGTGLHKWTPTTRFETSRQILAGWFGSASKRRCPGPGRCGSTVCTWHSAAARTR